MNSSKLNLCADKRDTHTELFEKQTNEITNEWKALISSRHKLKVLQIYAIVHSFQLRNK